MILEEVMSMWVFAICALTVLYAYAGYAALVWILSRLFGRKPLPPDAQTPFYPKVSLFIAAHNEQSMIESRILNALEMDYPKEQLEIVIGSDGSNDGTVEIVRRYADRGVRLFHYAQRRGKAAVLNSSFSKLTGDIVILSDANTFLDRDAVKQLIRWFAEPSIGVVCGRLVLTDPKTGNNVDSLYWKYETFLKKCESRLGALLGSNGAIYAIRLDLFSPIPSNTILDDFVIPLLAKLRSNCRIIYDTSAVAHEESAPDVGTEFRRRSRIGAGGFQSIGMLWRLLNPLRGWISFAFLSHKILRWLCPFALIGLIISNLFLLDQPIFRLIMFAQLGFYLISLLGPHLNGRNIVIRLIRSVPMFTGMNVALFVGFLRWLRGVDGTWQRTARTADLQPATAQVFDEADDVTMINTR
jgi:cellulose synthase/poly-beta-1,6-N-acetylglucosamine synthase-like glycosyltransferase